jgi:hypothetical protein
MWKKTLLALATVAALAGFGAISGDARAAGAHRPMPPRMHAPGPRIGAVPRVRPGYYAHTPRAGWHHPRRWHGRRSWGGWAGPGLLFYPPGVYGAYGDYTECRIVRKRVRVWTDDGWRRRWRRVRYCS